MFRRTASDDPSFVPFLLPEIFHLSKGEIVHLGGLSRFWG